VREGAFSALGGPCRRTGLTRSALAPAFCSQNPQTHRLEIKKIDVSVPSRSSISTFTRPYRFSVPIPDDSDASWLKTLGDWWEGEAGAADQGQEAAPEASS
jgi:hypothetical protein